MEIVNGSAARALRLLAALSATLMAALGSAIPQVLAAQWGSSYGDPPGFCAAQSRLPSTYLALPPTNDPLVGNNPEQDTFFGYHANPGYDNWYGSWYGDFRGQPGDSSGWQLIRSVDYPEHWHWNFADWSWSVHGHAKQYIAYYNWTFGGQCGMGWYGSPSPAPFMADVDGYPVMDIYVDTAPPFDPQPRVVFAGPAALTFSWDPVEDRGDGAGVDYFAVGMDHYTSWLSVDGATAVQRSDSPAPLVLTASLSPAQTACVFVVATDKLGNSTRPQSVCGRPAGIPPIPAPPAYRGAVEVNPSAPGLAGLPAWFWLEPAPGPVTVQESAGGVQYLVTATPQAADWAFGDGGSLANGGFGSAYPEPSTVRHVYGAASRDGYQVSSEVRYSLAWWFKSGGQWVGGYPLGFQSAPAGGLIYPVRQAQPELEMVP